MEAFICGSVHLIGFFWDLNSYKGQTQEVYPHSLPAWKFALKLCYIPVSQIWSVTTGMIKLPVTSKITCQMFLRGVCECYSACHGCGVSVCLPHHGHRLCHCVRHLLSATNYGHPSMASQSSMQWPRKLSATQGYWIFNDVSFLPDLVSRLWLQSSGDQDILSSVCLRLRVHSPLTRIFQKVENWHNWCDGS